MTQQMQIKDPAAKGSTPTEIKEATGFSYPTIRKYLAKEDFSPKRPVKRTEESILDPYKPLLAKMFERTGAFTTSSATRPSAYTGASSTSTGSRAATRRCSATRRS